MLPYPDYLPIRPTTSIGKNAEANGIHVRSRRPDLRATTMQTAPDDENYQQELASCVKEHVQLERSQDAHEEDGNHTSPSSAKKKRKQQNNAEKKQFDSETVGVLLQMTIKAGYGSRKYQKKA